MSLSTSRIGFKHRLDVQRDSAGGVDQWGNPSPPSWQSHLTDLPCRAWTNAVKEPVDDERTVVYEDRRVSIPLGTDVTENDRVLSITDANGNEIFEGPMGIEGVLQFTDHVELMLERIR